MKQTLVIAVRATAVTLVLTGVVYPLVITAIAQASFGMYLIHEIFNGIFFHILPDYFSHGLIYIPGTIILTSTLSFLTIHLLRKIPFMRVLC